MYSRDQSKAGPELGLEGEGGVAGPQRSAGPHATSGLVSHGLHVCVLISCLCQGDQSIVYLVGVSGSL